MEKYFLDICLIAVGASLLAWMACKCKQPILIGYFLCGVLFGPWGLKLINNTELLENISQIGITLLLFLAGLVLHPDRLIKFFKTAILVTITSSVITCLVVFIFMKSIGFQTQDSLIAGTALMFSSTILAIKLLPTTTLHQKRMGSICIAILIAEDILAVIVIMILGLTPSQNIITFLLFLNLKSILFIIIAFLFERYILRNMMKSVDKYNEVMLMLCLGWCLGVSYLADLLGLSFEIGAFIAGVIMSRNKISLFLSEQLKPLRDFFLMFFFFTLGAEFDLFLAESIWFPAICLAIIIITLRPLYLKKILIITGEEKDFAKEISFRLGQASEFALIIAVASVTSNRLMPQTSQLIQLTTIITMLISSYLVIFRYPTPIAPKKELKRD